MFGVTGTKSGSFKRKRYNWQTWYESGNYEVRTIQFVVVQVAEGFQHAPVFDNQKHPGKARREWERKVRVIEENNIIRNAGISRPLGRGAWEPVPIRRIHDFPKRKHQLPRRRSVKLVIIQQRLKRRRERQRVPGASARLGIGEEFAKAENKLVLDCRKGSSNCH